MTKSRWQACNVMRLGAEGPGLWQLSLSGGKFNTTRPTPLGAPAATDPKLIAKDWNELVKPRLNLAWLPADQLFIRVVQLPRTESAAELASMLEFQLEKLSPLPVAQILWTYEVVPARGMLETQTAVLIIVPRQAVEDLLGKLETNGYLADRIEVPILDQLLAVEVNRDCAILFPVTTQDGSRFVWTAWWYGGVLQSIVQFHVPGDASPGEVVQAQIGQMIWAGELEGWLNSPPRLFLVSDEVLGDEWLKALEGRFDPPVELIPAAPEASLAIMTARRGAVADPSKASLLPAEYTARYRQQYIDKLWMQTLFGLIACYLLGVLVYFGIVAFRTYERDNLFAEEVTQGASYTNALKLRDQVKILQEQINLQFLGLNCYLATATNLPAELALDQINFDRGSKLSVYGHGPAEAGSRVYEYVTQLKAAQFGGRRLFDSIDGPTVSVKPGGGQITWSLSANISKAEAE